MNERFLLELLLALTVSGGGMYLVTTLTGRLLRFLLTPRWQCRMYTAATLLYLVPVGMVVRHWWSAAWLAAPNTILADAIEVPAPLQMPLLTDAVQEAGARWSSLPAILLTIWLLGTLVILGLQMIRMRRLKHLVDTLSRPVEDRAVLQVFEQLWREMGLSGRVRLQWCLHVSSPMLMGLWRPVLLLPRVEIDTGSLLLVLRHELIHFKRRDLWGRWAAMFARALHWWNPLVWLSAAELVRWQEEACDSEVVQSLSHGERIAYGELILNALGGDMVAGIHATLSADKKHIKERLNRMLNHTKPTRKRQAACALSLVLVLCLGTAVSAAAQPESEGMARQTERLVLQSATDEATRPEDLDLTVAPGIGLKDDGNTSVPQPESERDTAQSDTALIQSDEDVQIRLEETSQAALPTFLWPTDGGVGITYDGHAGMGLDINRPLNTDVYAAAAGVVVQSIQGVTGYGNHVIVDHGGGWQTVYAHCSELDVEAGDQVLAGQRIAGVGRSGWATGIHLHFEVRSNGAYMDPRDYVTSPVA